MNKKILIIAAITIAIIVGIAVSALSNSGNQPPQTSDTKVSTSTSKTEKTDANVTTDREGIFDTSADSDTSTNTSTIEEQKERQESTQQAEYIEFASADQFKATKGTRILFFYTASSKACQKLDKDLTENITMLAPGITVFKIDFKKYKDIAAAYGVVKESTILKFDERGRVDGLFFAQDYPTVAALKTNLEL